MHVSILSYPCPSMMSIGGQVGLRRSHHLDHLLSCCIMQACKNTCMSAKATVEASASFLSIYLSFLHVHRFWHRTERPEAHQTALNKITRCTLDTRHCTLHTAHCTLHPAHCTLDTAHCTLHTTLYTTAHYTQIHTTHLNTHAQTHTHMRGALPTSPPAPISISSVHKHPRSA